MEKDKFPLSNVENEESSIGSTAEEVIDEVKKTVPYSKYTKKKYTPPAGSWKDRKNKWNCSKY